MENSQYTTEQVQSYSAAPKTGLVSKNYFPLYQTIIMAIVIFISAILIAGIGSSYIKSIAIDGCINSSTYMSERNSATGEKITITSHIDEWYLQCMEDKGYSTTRVAPL